MILLPLLLSISSISIASGSSLSKLRVDGLYCESVQSGEICDVHLQGTVATNEALLLDGFSESDRTYFKEAKIGETGFFFGYPFYARFIPRVYPLDLAIGVKNPTIRIETVSLSGITEKAPHSTTTLKIVPSTSGPWILASFLAKLLLELFALGALAVFAFPLASVASYDGWSWPRKSLLLMYSIALFWGFEMTQIPRVLIPSILSGARFFQFHAISEAFLLWALADVLVRTTFEDATYIITLGAKSAGRGLGVLTTLNTAMLVLALCVIILKFGWDSRDAHAISVFMQAAVLAALVILKNANYTYPIALRRALPSSRMFHIAHVATALLLVRDAVVYMWFHNASTTYLIPYGFFAILLVGGARARAVLSLERESRDFATETRQLLQSEPSARRQLTLICEKISNRWNFARVSIISIRENQGLVIASAGSKALAISPAARPLGPFLQRLVDASRLIFVGHSREFSDLPETACLQLPCVGIPIIQNGTAVAAITVMTDSHERFPVRPARLLSITTSTISVEVISALNLTISEEREHQLRSIASTTSGIVLEQTDSWGRLRSHQKPVRRFILSADGIKSTHVDQIAVGSPLIWELMKHYKKDIYSGWIAIKDVFELVSKDLRGDDLWLLSPEKFRNPYLESLGPAAVTLLASFLVEEHSRRVSAQSDYQVLGRAGSHVAVSVDDIEILHLGTQRSTLVDVHGKHMSATHRIRSAAEPGAVLVDVSDTEIRRALSRSDLFTTRNASVDLGDPSTFADVQQLPSVVSLVGIGTSPELTALLKEIEGLVATSPFRSHAA